MTQAVQSTEVVPDAAVRHSRPALHSTDGEGPAYAQLQPRLGPFTLFIVEVLYALFIDSPIAALYVALTSNVHQAETPQAVS